MKRKYQLAIVLSVMLVSSTALAFGKSKPEDRPNNKPDESGVEIINAGMGKNLAKLMGPITSQNPGRQGNYIVAPDSLLLGTWYKVLEVRVDINDNILGKYRSNGLSEDNGSLQTLTFTWNEFNWLPKEGSSQVLINTTNTPIYRSCSTHRDCKSYLNLGPIKVDAVDKYVRFNLGWKTHDSWEPSGGAHFECGFQNGYTDRLICLKYSGDDYEKAETIYSRTPYYVVAFRKILSPAEVAKLNPSRPKQKDPILESY